MTRRPIVPLLALASGAALALAACGGGDGPAPLVVAVGGAPAELAVWEAMVDDFADRTGIAVEILRQPSDTAQQRQALVVALSAGRPDPDVFLMDVAWIALFAEAGWLRPLDAAAPDTAALFGRVVDAVDRFDGALLALPIYLDAGLLYYRRDLLRAHGIDGPPATWRALVDAARTVQAAERPDDPDFHGFVWQGAQYEGLVVNFLEFAGRDGGLERTRDGWRVDTAANRRALALMHDLVHELALSPPATITEMREEEVRAHFQRGDALFERNWPYAYTLHQQPDSPVWGRVGVAPLPGPGTLGGWHVGVSRHGDRPRDALRFVSWLTSRAVQKEMVRRLGWNPGRRDLYDDPDLARELPHLAALEPVFRGARSRPTVPWYPQLSAVLQRRLSAALAGRATPGEALAAAEAELDALSRYYAREEADDGR